MSFTLLSKMNQLEQQVEYLTTSQQDVSYRIDNQASQVYNALEEFKNDQSWISRITMNIDTKDLKDDQVNATFNWQVKELQNDSEVVFHYSYGRGEEYTAIPAKELQNGLFQVIVPFEFEKEPQWQVGNISSDSYRSEAVSETEAIDGRIQDSINFYVTVSYEDLVKSSEIQNEYLEDWKARYYGVIQTDVHIYNSKLDITLINYQSDEKSSYVEKAFLQKYKGNTLTDEEELKMMEEFPVEEYSEHFFYLNQVEQKENIRYVIKVVYSNGDTFEKEIY
ncbi:hypothetical protein V7147_06910 [Bacillus sp. JJ1521]|uniref:hypothetical protein n=1 Tax=Bacillus sp. JJ1521 TaxID=3122957 RepID=UPI002FFEB6A5